jgi:nitrile hydratase accessory protein
VTESPAGRLPTIREAAESLRLPSGNGEPVFESGWQAQAFGLVVGLWQAGHYQWDDFKTLLIGEIEADSKAGTDRGYYVQFLDAFTKLAFERKLVTEAELSGRMDQFLNCSRPEQYLGSAAAQGQGISRLLDAGKSSVAANRDHAIEDRKNASAQ